MARSDFPIGRSEVARTKTVSTEWCYFIPIQIGGTDSARTDFGRL